MRMKRQSRRVLVRTFIVGSVLALSSCGGGKTEPSSASTETTTSSADESSTTVTAGPTSVDAPALSYIPATGEGAARLFTVEMTDSTDGE